MITDVASAVATAMPDVRIVYGSVFPTYHWHVILTGEQHVTAIVRREGEETVRRLMAAIAAGADLASIPGIAYRREGIPYATAPAPVIHDLDAHRVG